MADDALLLAFIQEAVRENRVAFTSHSLTTHPVVAEGFTADDALQAILNGQVIEHRERDSTCVISGAVRGLGITPDYIANYIHCVCRYDECRTSSSSPCTVPAATDGLVIFVAGQAIEEVLMVEDLHAALRNSDLCGANAEETATTLRFDYGRVVVVFNDVPALYCPDIDETLVPGPVGVVVSDLAAETARMAEEFLARLETESHDLADQRIEVSQRFNHMLTA